MRTSDPPNASPAPSSVGTSLPLVSPSPSWPKLPLPHTHSTPSSASATVCAHPAATSTTLPPPNCHLPSFSGASLCCSSLWPRQPACPDPQVKTSPSAVAATLWLDPQAAMTMLAPSKCAASTSVITCELVVVPWPSWPWRPRHHDNSQVITLVDGQLGQGEYLYIDIHMYSSVTCKHTYTSVQYGMETRALVSGQFLDR